MAAPRKLAGFEFYKKILGSPKYVVAPMVDQSELAWRELSRKYGAQLCYTPMIHSEVYTRSAVYRSEIFSTASTDRPLIAQLCGNDPKIVLACAKQLEGQVDAIDLNFGCPQNIAKRGRYGAFLQDEWDVISSLVKTLHEELIVPVTCKIRMFPDRAKTIEYAKMIEASGCQLLTIHGRTIRQKGQLTGLADWETIKAVKEALTIPVFANGNVLYYEDVQKCLEETGVDGVMSAEGNLSNPTLFSGPDLHKLCEVTDIYLEIAKKHDSRWSATKAHLFRMWHDVLTRETDLRAILGSECRCIEDVETKIIPELKRRLAAYEATGVDEINNAITHNTLGCPSRVKPPIWMSQPKVRNIEKDGLAIKLDQEAQTRKRQRQIEDAAVAEKKRNATNSPNIDAPKIERVKPAKVQRIEDLKQGKKGWKFCVKCNNNPSGKRCKHDMCKTCCKSRDDKLSCHPHKIHGIDSSPRAPYNNSNNNDNNDDNNDNNGNTNNNIDNNDNNNTNIDNNDNNNNDIDNNNIDNNNNAYTIPAATTPPTTTTSTT